MGERDQFMHPLLGYNLQSQSQGEEPPQFWLDQSVQLRNGGRKIEGTIPSQFASHADIDKSNPPEVTVYFDPHTGLAMFDLMGHFNGGER